MQNAGKELQKTLHNWFYQPENYIIYLNTSSCAITSARYHVLLTRIKPWLSALYVHCPVQYARPKAWQYAAVFGGEGGSLITTVWSSHWHLLWQRRPPFWKAASIRRETIKLNRWEVMPRKRIFERQIWCNMLLILLGILRAVALIKMDRFCWVDGLTDMKRM